MEMGRKKAKCPSTLLSVFKVFSAVAEGMVRSWMPSECCSLAFSLSRPGGFVPMFCSSSSAEPTHMMGSFPVLTITFYCAGVRGRQKFSPLPFPHGLLHL